MARPHYSWRFVAKSRSRRGKFPVSLAALARITTVQRWGFERTDAKEPSTDWWS